MSSFYDNARVRLQAQIDKARRAPQLHPHDLINWRDQCLNLNFTTWMNRSFQGPERIRYNQICEQARRIPPWVAREAARDKGFLSKETPRWLRAWGIGAGVAITAALGAKAFKELHPCTRSGRKHQRDIEADADGEAPPPQKVLRRATSPEPGSTDRKINSFPDASAFPSLTIVPFTPTVLSTGMSLSADELKSEAETSITDPVSVEAEEEDLADDDDDRDHDEHNEHHETGSATSVQAENEGRDEEEIKIDGSGDGEIEEEGTIDESETKETGNKA